ncbi:class I SAM-dependent methyltransferase [Nitratifractor salsuginis]|uniref:Methyltransferase type 11 n=1 Tax=Nitratifractor salsuginis (strain DSM 16511 / JCM 12458 / E9I37-1) TaxID=749222 RepID=E6WY05_NITSE|nr:class I SAM-dependent methyltransferase [Nitratifractor salsuginis]ADV46379.1 Methyltransferase type 11 [Nitratifractor salsuginis DSM 16511]
MARIDQIAFYDEKLRTYGLNAEGVAWDSARTQRRRFGAIASCLGRLQGDTLVDAGCGLGDFYLYLQEQGNLPGRYIGIDLHPEMAAAARERTGCEILRRDILRQKLPLADWYVASGSMNLLTRTETGIFIRRCFEKSRKGFVFNLLEGRERSGEFGYWKPREVIELCRPLGATVSIKEGYLEGDFTVFLHS